MGRPHSSWLTKHGYRFVEGKDFASRPMRISLGTDNRLFEQRNVTLKSKFRFERVTTEFGAGFTRSEYRVSESQTADVLARYVNASYRGGWAERLLGAFSDSGGQLWWGVLRGGVPDLARPNCYASSKDDPVQIL